jgi:hypothetical protein
MDALKSRSDGANKKAAADFSGGGVFRNQRS